MILHDLQQNRVVLSSLLCKDTYLVPSHQFITKMGKQVTLIKTDLRPFDVQAVETVVMDVFNSDCLLQLVAVFKETSKTRTVVIDSLNNWLLAYTLDRFYPVLLQIIHSCSVIAIYHKDLLIKSCFDIEQVFEDVFDIHVDFKSDHGSTLLKKKSGKVIKENFTFQPNPFRWSLVEEVVGFTSTEKIKDLNFDHLSFNVSLSESQRAQKEGVVLPYLKAQEEKEAVIHYIAEKQDDFDSDDPDDDLDI